MICFLDFETTGIDVFKDRPIEIGALLVNNNFEIIKSFHSFINPEIKRHFKASAIQTHGIANIIDLKDAPFEKDVLISFFENIGTNYVFCSWNISFDVTFFRRMCHRNNKMREYNKINYRHLDLQSIMKYYNYINNISLVKNSLDENLKELNIKRSRIHSALEDSKLLFELYKVIYIKGLSKKVE